jgi:hypothetical protein
MSYLCILILYFLNNKLNAQLFIHHLIIYAELIKKLSSLVIYLFYFTKITKKIYGDAVRCCLVSGSGNVFSWGRCKVISEQLNKNSSMFLQNTTTGLRKSVDNHKIIQS